MSASERRCFAAAAEGFVTAVGGVGSEDWSRPGLGVWSVRDLVGHTSRSFTTIETYLADPPAEIVLHQPVEYLQAVRGAGLESEAIVARGRAAGVALGEDPLAAIGELATRVLAMVAATPDEAPMRTFAGGAQLGTYLPTRTFELTVHTLDLTTALGQDPPAILQEPIAACLALAAAVAGAGGGSGAVLLQALTGRRALPPGFSII
ncbi:MAG: hypothetical protein QOK39_1462 [Acidimicrobiaceae bacterium]|nr:hypothetical protein [Acidimicrobiaceae bacterium]